VFTPTTTLPQINLFRASDLDCFLHIPLHEPFDDEAEELERHSGYARDTRGQIATYLTAMQVSQYRTHSFGVIIFGATCRLLRHTQSGTEITPSFDYTTTAHLQTFFWRLSHASPAQRGVDTTFLSVGRELEDRARKLLNAKDENLYKVCVGDRTFFVSTPFTRTPRTSGSQYALLRRCRL
jgi:hypothetical protein